MKSLKLRPLISIISIFALTISALFLFAPAACLCASEPNLSDPHAPELSILDIADLLNVKVVTAEKKPETISNTPAAVFVITRQDIDHHGYQTLAQAVKSISGFYTETDRLYDFIGVRGYLPNGDLNRRVLVLIDGHKINDYLYGQASVDEDLPIDLQDIERIEVVKGPGSSVWGSEALLCVINCITKSASDIDGFETTQELGFRKGQHFAYGKAFSNGVEVTANMTNLTSDGQHRFYSSDFDTPQNNNGVAVGLDGERVNRGNINNWVSTSVKYGLNKKPKWIPALDF